MVFIKLPFSYDRWGERSTSWDRLVAKENVDRAQHLWIIDTAVTASAIPRYDLWLKCYAACTSMFCCCCCWCCCFNFVSFSLNCFSYFSFTIGCLIVSLQHCIVCVNLLYDTVEVNKFKPECPNENTIKIEFSLKFAFLLVCCCCLL